MIWTIWWEMNTRGGLINFLLRWSFLQNQMGSLSLTVHPILYQFDAKISQLLSPCENILIIITLWKSSIIITIWKYLNYYHNVKISWLPSPWENISIIFTMWKCLHYYHHVKMSSLLPCEKMSIIVTTWKYLDYHHHVKMSSFLIRLKVWALTFQGFREDGQVA